MEERGGVSSCSLSFKETCTETGAVFEEVKRVLFYTTIEEFEPKYITNFPWRTLRIIGACGKWASFDPFKA